MLIRTNLCILTVTFVTVVCVRRKFTWNKQIHSSIHLTETIRPAKDTKVLAFYPIQVPYSHSIRTQIITATLIHQEVTAYRNQPHLKRRAVSLHVSSSNVERQKHLQRFQSMCMLSKISESPPFRNYHIILWHIRLSREECQSIHQSTHPLNPTTLTLQLQLPMIALPNLAVRLMHPADVAL
jgi:hypothetical protein